jgi:hypothetical protein
MTVLQQKLRWFMMDRTRLVRAGVELLLLRHGDSWGIQEEREPPPFEAITGGLVNTH